ncbi:MAG: PQQ-binding-like beta-propeller repeat protein [Myxococcales bacterium]|nr:PQQ-binding-like beta-propeller repeat protein [Myxococcales bacterium]
MVCHSAVLAPISLRRGSPLGLLLSSLWFCAGCDLPAVQQEQPTHVGLAAAALSDPPAPGCVVATRDGREYWFCVDESDWNEARGKCLVQGMDLVRVDNQDEEDFLRMNLVSAAWMGATDLSVEGEWLWIDNGDQFWSGGGFGSAVGGLYENWTFLEPSNLGGQDCATMSDSPLDGWRDRDCGDNFAYVCEGALAADDEGLACTDTAGPAAAPWPAFGRCLTQQAVSPVVGAQEPSPVSTFTTGDEVISSPAVGADGTVYVGSEDGFLYAVNPDGTQQWAFDAGDAVRSSPAIGSDGTIYVGSDDGRVFAVTPTGDELWNFRTWFNVRSGPRVAPDGTIYVGSDNGRLYALSPTGDKLWHLQTPSPVRSSVAIGLDGTIYAGSDGWIAYAINPDGSPRWTFQALGPISATPALGPDGTVYIVSFDGHLHALNPGNGTLRWRYLLGAPSVSSPALGPDGIIILGDSLGRVRGIAPDGQLAWETSLGAAVLSSPAIGADGTVYIGASDGRLYALDGTTGLERWSVQTGDEIISSPAIGANGTIYVGSLDHNLYSIGGGPKPLLQCVSQVGANRYAALFGYDNRLPIELDIPVGADNQLSPTPTPAVSPIETFEPGVVDTAFWVPFDAGTTMTWTLRGRSVTADQDSEPCTTEAYPEPPTDPILDEAMGMPEDPSSVAPSRPKLASYYTDAQRQPPTMDTSASTMHGGGGTQSTSNGVGVVTQALSSVTLPFKLTLTSIIAQQDGGLASLDVDARVFINGVELPNRHLFTCGSATVGCILGPMELDEEFTLAVPIDQPTVPVRIEIIERDNASADDIEVTVDLVVDNTDGTWTGTVASPTDCHTSGSDWTICWDVMQTGIPSGLSSPRVCGVWPADYVDEGFGEDTVGTPSPGGDHDEYPAAFAEFILEVQGPTGNVHVGAFYENGVLQSGTPAFLDSEGCIPAGVIPVEALLFVDGAAPGDLANGGLEMSLVYRTTFERSDGVRFSLRDANDLNFGVINATLSEGDIPVSQWSTTGPWAIPPTEVRTHTPVIGPVTEASATISQLLRIPDAGIVPDLYHAAVNDGCTFGGKVNSCVSVSHQFPPQTFTCDPNADQCPTGLACRPIGADHFCAWVPRTLFSGPATLPPNSTSCTTDADCPSVQMCLPDGSGGTACHWPPQSRWKFIVAHEAGHQIQERAMGLLGGTYTFSCPPGATCPGKREASGPPSPTDPLVDPPFIDPLCGCQHVEAANAQHCLQSVERAPRAHMEGYAQFYASKTWNHTGDTDCSFVYYKEFLFPGITTCPAGQDCTTFTTTEHGDLLSILPPVSVSCRQPWTSSGGVTGWRNNFCPVSEVADFATELDMMGFLWNINTADGNAGSSMAEIFEVYRRACHPEQDPPTDRCQSADVGWEPMYNDTSALVRPGFREGAELTHGTASEEYEEILLQGRIFGITPELP